MERADWVGRKDIDKIVIQSIASGLIFLSNIFLSREKYWSWDLGHDKPSFEDKPFDFAKDKPSFEDKPFDFAKDKCRNEVNE